MSFGFFKIQIQLHIVLKESFSTDYIQVNKLVWHNRANR